MALEDVAYSAFFWLVEKSAENIFTQRNNVTEICETIEKHLEEGPLIFAIFPHTMFLDVIVGGYPYYRIHGETSAGLVKDKHIDNKLYGWILKKTPGLIRADYKGSAKKSIQRVIDQSKKFLEDGVSVGLAPEGTRYHTNQEVYEEIMHLKETGEDYSHMLKKLKVFGSFLQIAFESNTRVLPVWLERSGFKGLRYTYVLDEPRIFTTENSPFRPVDEFDSEVRYMKQFRRGAQEFLIEAYTLSPNLSANPI